MASKNNAIFHYRMIKSIRELKNLKGKTVLLRADFNVPIQNNKVVDPFRILKSLPTIQYLKLKKAKIIIISHAGEDGGQSLLPVAKVLSKHISASFVPEIFGTKAEKAISKMKPGDILLLENLRTDAGEKNNDVTFSKKLAGLAGVYVNEAFPVSHRAHASIVGIPKYLPSYAGLQLTEEIKQLSKMLHPKHPFLFILGGAKFETKMPLIKKYLKTADHLFIGGALANNFFREEGLNIGDSLIDKSNFHLKKILSNKKILLPVDVVVKGPKGIVTEKSDEVLPHEKIVDAGPKSIEMLIPYIKKAKAILWNGPLGNYENGFKKGTELLLYALASAKGETVIGGGDTAALISKKMEKKFSFISTGGGATLEFLTYGTLPGIEALNKSKIR